MPADTIWCEPLSVQLDKICAFLAGYEADGVMLDPVAMRAFGILFKDMAWQARCEEAVIAREAGLRQRDESGQTKAVRQGVAAGKVLLLRPQRDRRVAAVGDISTEEALAWLASDSCDWGDAP